MQPNMKFQPDVTSRTKKNHSLKFVRKAVIRHLGIFYEAKKGLRCSQITRAYVKVRISY